MKELTKNELRQINGGGISIELLTIVTLGVAFVAGIIDGFFRPLKCR